MQAPFSPCPICKKTEIANSLSCKDYSLTNEPFEVIQCSHCTLKYTASAPSIDQIAPYYNFPNYISHTDTKNGLINFLYHKIRSYTLDQKTAWIQSLFTGFKGKILEVGAGTGAFAHAMQQKGWEVTALEPDEASRQKALENYNLNLLSSTTLFDLNENTYDVITLWHVLEHVHELEKYIQTFKKLLKNKGKLIIAVPNYTSFDAQFYKKYWAAYDVPRHLYHFSAESMNFLINSNGMKVVGIKPMWFDSFYVSLLSEKYKKTGAFGLIRAVVVGLLSNLSALKNPSKASSLIYTITH